MTIDRSLFSSPVLSSQLLLAGSLALVAGLAGCGNAPTPSSVPAPAPVAVSDAVPSETGSAIQSTAEPLPLPATMQQTVQLTSPEADQLFATLAATETTPEDWERAQTRLVELGEAAVPTLSRELASPNTFHREVAASALAMLGPAAEAATAELRRALKDDSVHVRANAATALCAIPEQADVVVPVLTELLQNADPQVRQMSAVNLSNFGVEAAPFVPQLAAALESAPEDVLVPVVELLGRIGPEAESATPRLQQIAFEQSGEAREAANAALERIAEKPPGE